MRHSVSRASGARGITAGVSPEPPRGNGGAPGGPRLMRRGGARRAAIRFVRLPAGERGTAGGWSGLETRLRGLTVRLLLLVLPLLLSLDAVGASAQVRRNRPSQRRPARPAQPPAKPVAAPSAASITTPSGLTYLITRRGEGRAPQAGEEVLVHYTGLLTDGTVFDSSRNRGEPFAFRLGAGRVIKGWDEGIARLRVGDRATLFIPPQLGYGARGAGGVIPPDASLIFVVELVGIRGEAPQPGEGRPPGQ